ncbi:MAG: hypothetical protein NZ455_10220 [Bacteroidia bacterium]|nr:hypothetical protein [Bacteroidia bacterium]MDW8346974.1 hypothetical protein [Bacteroidia bacterium]
MISTGLSAIKVGLKTIILHAGISVLCAFIYITYMLIHATFRGLPNINWLGWHALIWFILFILTIISTVVLGVIIGVNVAVQKVLLYLLTHYEPYLWEYILKYLKKNHSGPMSKEVVEKHLQTLTRQINDLPWLIKKAIILFIELFPVADIICKKSYLLVESNFDEKKIAQELAKEKNELEEVKISKSPWLIIILLIQTSVFILYWIFS